MKEREGSGNDVGSLTPLQRAVRIREMRNQEGDVEKKFENMNARAKKEPTSGTSASVLERSEILFQKIRGEATGEKNLKSRF